MDRASFFDWQRGAVVLAAGIVVVAAVAPSGCGLPGEADTIFGGGTGNATTTGSGVTAGPGTTSASSAGGETSSSESSSSAGGAGGAGGDTSSSTTSESSSSTTSTSSGPAPMINCGPVDCPQGGANGCCWDEHQFGEPPQGVCVDMPPDDCNTAIAPGGAHSRIACQLPEHCPGQICCGNRADFFLMGNQFFYYVDVTCQNECDYNQDQRVICDPASPDCPMVNVNGMQVQLECVNSSLLPAGYGVCAVP